MVPIIIAGVAGRMGRRIVHMVCQNPETELAGAFERPDHPSLGQDAGTVAGVGETGVEICDSLSNVLTPGAVLIDFTQPESTLSNIRYTAEKGVPSVIGTTGIPADGVDEIASLAEKTPCVMAPNMSLGMNLLFSMVEQAAGALQDKGYDVEIIRA